MKKLLALALTAMMLVCAIAPAMAATHTTTDGLTIESLVPNAALPDEFVEAGEINTVDYIEDNSTLVLDTDYWVRPDDHAYGGAGICVAPGVKYAMTFTVEEAGTYEFCVEHFVRRDDLPAGYPHASSVQVDDGTLYSVNEDDADAVTLGAINYYTGMTVELTAGEHTFYLVGDKQNGINAYFAKIYYYQVGADNAAEDTSADDTTTAAPSEDTTASQGGEQTSPATFDAAIIALAVAGASAAVAVVSKKRR